MAVNALSTSAAVLRETIDEWRFVDEPDLVFEEAARRLSDGQTLDTALVGLERKLMLARGIGSQYTLTEAVSEQYAPLAVAFARQLIEEYDCAKPSEVASAELAAASYVQYITHSKRVVAFPRDTVTHREADRAYRRYFGALTTLRFLKAPPVQVNVVKAETAFVAQTQAVHHDQRPPT